MWKPNYFEEKKDEGDTLQYTYCRDYWQDRADSNWDHLEDIFGLETGREVIMPEND